MGVWLFAAIILQLACAGCAARLARPAIWLQIILLLPIFGSLAYCVFEILRGAAPEGQPRPAARQPAFERANGIRSRLGHQAVRARTVDSRRALAEECLRIGRHADARLLFQSCLVGRRSQDPRLIAGLEQATALMGATSRPTGRTG